MSKNKLWLLLKVQMHESFAGSRGRTAAGETGKRRRRSGQGNLPIIVSVIVIVAFVSMVLTGLGLVMHELGMDYIVLLFSMVGASLFSLVTSVYQVNGLLFGYKDYSLTMALPFPTSTIVACRIILLYVWNLAYCAAIMLPAGVIYAVLTGAAWYFWPLYVVLLLLTPLLPSIIATAIGTVIALISSRFKRRGVAGIIIALVFIILYMLVVLNMDRVLDTLEQFGPQIAAALSSAWPPASWFIDAACSYNMGAFALFAAVSLGAFWIFCWVVGKYFVRMNSALLSRASGADFKMTAQKTADPQKALIRKEFRRLFGSSAYFLNTCISNIMAIFFAALIVFGGSDLVMSSFVPEGEGMADIPIDLGPVVAAVLSFFASISTTTAVSISIEGKEFWILKTLPLSSWEILKSKQNMNMIIVIITSIAVGTFLSIAFPQNPMEWPLYYLLPFACGAFMTMFGQVVGLKYARLDWASETKLLKQGKAVTICTLTGMAIGIASIICTISFGAAACVIEICIMILLAVLLRSRLKKRGPAEFDALTGG